MHGLTSTEAAQLTKQWGPNELSEKKVGPWEKVLRAVIAPASLMLVAASALSFFLNRQFDGFFILSLLVLNVGMGLWHGRKADKALEGLRAQLSVSAQVLRDGAWKTVPSRALVPGDVIRCSVGALVPADARVETAGNLEINEAVLTGESLPKAKKGGDETYSGSVVVAGTFTGTVTATGNRAFFGKIATSAKDSKRTSAMEKEILSISRFLIVASLLAIAILTSAFVLTGVPLGDIAILDLSLLIAGLPVSLPTVMTLIVSIGAVAVANKKALVRRLAALEDFANVTLLLTDKTGTLTENKITVERVHAYAPFTEAQLREYAVAGALANAESLIDKAIVGVSTEASSGYKTLDARPADSVRKRSTTLVEKEGVRYLITLGTPPVVGALCGSASALVQKLSHDTSTAAKDGSRAIAVAIKKQPKDLDDEKDMELLGLLVLSDPLRADAPKTLQFLAKEGVRAIMVTGDTKETAEHVAGILGLPGRVVRPADIDLQKLTADDFATAAAFAEVMPEDKLTIVTAAQGHYVVASTGDGVNDLPAVRKADVGIAVANAVEALKGTADIVLLDSGIGVLETALIEARKIFFRLYYYSVYRISESFRLVITALVLGLVIKGFPLTPVQIILLAFLNDVPIITLAFDRVQRTDRPASIAKSERFTHGTLYGLVGVCESLTLYFLLANVVHLPMVLIQTAFFLKLTVSGHMLIYVAHTKERWWKFLPAKSIIVATSATQAFATLLAVAGIFVPAIPWQLALLVWGWTFVWMQVTEFAKFMLDRFLAQRARAGGAPSTPALKMT